MVQCTEEELAFILNHVILPPRLLQKAENDELIADAEQILLKLVHAEVKSFQQHCAQGSKDAWFAIEKMLSAWIGTNPHQALSTDLFKQAFTAMRCGDVLPVRIRAQNAGLIFRHVGSSMNVESFELSPCSGDVIKCQGSLRRAFPARGLAISTDFTNDTLFCQELCAKLSKLDSETVSEMMPQSRKGGSAKDEIRDTCHPGLVTEMLMACLAAVGTPLEVLQIAKRVRDDVLWHNCLVPWRRSSFWLILRVSIQTTLAQNLEDQEAFVHYKNFMIYLLAAILKLAVQSDADVELCKINQMKIARRAAKLGDMLLPFVQKKALAIVDEVNESHEKMWREIQRRNACRGTKINTATVEEDIALTLHNCRPALDSALRKPKSNFQPPITISPSSTKWIITSYDAFPVIQQFLPPEENIHALAEFEEWIWQSLPSWLEKTVSHPDAGHCRSIAVSAEAYKRMALEAYDGCAEQQSFMLLAIGELWRALDTIAGCLMPLLHQYLPEIPASLFQPLLLPEKAQMQRLQELEAYLNGRHDGAKFTQLSFFREPSVSDLDYFSSKYFEQSNHHQSLRQQIVAKANDRHTEKKREWQQGTSRYDDLKKELTSISQCEMSINEYGIEGHSTECRKCELKKLMNQMTIAVFEWPLPSNEVQCRHVIFELHCPAEFAAWRNLTWMLIQDLSRTRDTLGKEPNDRLSTYSGLSSYCESSTSRIVVAASTKSITASHYRRIRYPTELENVSCAHGLTWKSYDSARKLWVHDQTEIPSFSGRCETILPNGPYKNLQYAVNSTTHGQNEVLASQSQCNSELSLHEYIAYGSLRADGEKTQWLNICRELGAANLSWNTEAVCSLVRQSAWQVGTASDTFLRTAHSILRTPEFCEELLAKISRVVTSVQANRRSAYAMKALIILILRTLSLGVSGTVPKALSLLRTCRSTLSCWIGGLADALRTTTSAIQIAGIRRDLLRIALTCKMTFDVDMEYISRVLASSDDVHHWTASAIIVQDNLPGAESALPADLRLLLLRDRKLNHSLHGRLQDLLTNSENTGLDRSVLNAWSSFQSSSKKWQYDGEAGDVWLCKRTLSGPCSGSQSVHYNVLNGQLLVDGRPLGTLPKEYTSHSLFVRIFGAQILRIATSDTPGMLYMTVYKEYGYRFYFIMSLGELVIRAQDASTTFEIVPHHHFTDDFPALLVEDCVHWFNVRTSEVEFRPLSRKWTMDVDNWRLYYRPQGVSHARNSDCQLVDIRSRTYETTLSVFGGLEKAEFMHVTKSFDGRFEVALPRLGLHFFINSEEDLECRELRKVVDRDQSIGTLVGLKSRLVLCAPGDKARNLDRIVLIPQGGVYTSREGSHLAIQILSTDRHVPCLRYQHDPLLNRLEGDGTVVSRLYQAYLHAVSSYILPDPLTGSLGTEESIRILSEQSYRCCKPLEDAEIDLLDSIAALTPKRSFYPSHLKVMQEVFWHGVLGPLSQHSEFLSLAERILDHSQRFNVFYHGSASHRTLGSRGDARLLQRAKLRNSVHLNVDYGGDKCTAHNDMDYKGRDGPRDVGRAARVHEISSLIASWSSYFAIDSQDLVQKWKSLGTVSGFGTAFDFSTSVTSLLKLSFADSWAPLYQYCRRATRETDRYKLLFLFSDIAYGSNVSSLDDLKTVFAFATNPSMRNLPPFPKYNSFTLIHGSCPERSKLRSTIASHVKPWPGAGRNVTADIRRRQHIEYQRESSSNVTDATNFCEKQWPCKAPSSIPSSCSKWLRTIGADSAVGELFAMWYGNRECEHHLRMMQGVLNSLTASTSYSTYSSEDWQKVKPHLWMARQSLPTMTGLMATMSPTSPGYPPPFHITHDTRVTASNQEIRELVLNGLGAKSSGKESPIRTRYKDDLLASLDAFERHRETVLPTELSCSTTQEASAHLDQCERAFLDDFQQLCDTLRPSEPMPHLLMAAGLWPRLQKHILLEAVATRSRAAISPCWKKSILAIGEALTILQRARRLVLAAEKHDALSFFKEAENPGRLGWNVHDWPDWLLMEIENNLLIRDIQARVALEMIEPLSSSNTLMQLNMGEGKSSVILPLIAAALAAGNRLSRVVVLRSLMRQMQDVLVRRLGGLARRPIYCMPFSRRTSIDESTIQQMQAMYTECMASGGILIAQPEHLLSFQLMGIERLVAEHNSAATKLLETQAWLDRHCRDVLDESDEVLDVKFQLIYTLGNQHGIDGQPDRWLMMQGVFDIVQRQADLLQQSNPDQIEVEKQTSASFPAIRLLSSRIRRQLISRVFEDICDSRIPGLVMSNLPSHVKKAAKSLIADGEVSESDCNVIRGYCADDELYLKKLLFVRGLIAGGILLHALHAKRWSVNYGLHPTRCLCAVPYRAKGVPAATAEFGHPDVTIALTCLSYYYTGLKDSQIRSCLEILQKADDPTAEYDTWTQADEAFPRELCHWNAVNLEDQQQCLDQLFPSLRNNKKAADFFLANVVFPKEGKEFDQKLSTSGWDIPAKPASDQITTGFSGTNDNRFLLPSFISQRDLPELRHTSGKVLDCVSKPENLSYFCAKDEKGVHLSSGGLLQFINHSDSTVRVLIDVGAQILDLSNDQVIRKWLDLVPDPDADAGVYFDENDYAMVLTRAGKKEELVTSSFSNRMDRCIVYLDEVHTRACMRLRQLGQGQSLMFVAPPEVHQEIMSNSLTTELNGLHVIGWALEQSCLQIERNQPLRVVQGLNYYRRQQAMDELRQGLLTSDISDIEDLAQRLVEHEAQSLQDLYAPEVMREEDESDLIRTSRRKPDPDIQDLITLWDQIDLQATRRARMHEEHEREVAQEVEQETQVERPPVATPEHRQVDSGVRAFIRSGIVSGLMKLATVCPSQLLQSSAAPLLKGRTKVWSHLRVSQDFVKAVQRDKTSSSDEFFRPVHWLLVSTDPAVQNVILVSQYEVNQLLDEIHASGSCVALVCYEPRVTRSMLSLEVSVSQPLPKAKEAWETLSAEVRQELHLFAGQLYFTTFAEYARWTGTLATQEAAPLSFVKEWIGIRRKGQNYLQTHVGQVVSGRVLHEEMFDADGQ
ncbi:MAG: hypothetical protein Q9211_005078 [Gyalolechia sp. 1 TL-2023]